MTVQQDLDEIFTIARTAVTRAGEAVVSARQLKPLTISFKAPRDLVTNADIEADRIIASTIRSRFPDHLILSKSNK